MGVSSFAASLEPARRYLFLTYYYALQLQRCRRTRALVEKWWSAAESVAVLQDWLELLAALAAPQRLAFARWLDTSGEIQRPVPPGLERFLADHGDLAPELVRELREGTSVEFIESWLALARHEGFHARLTRGKHREPLPVERLLRIAEGDVHLLSNATEACLQSSSSRSLIMREELDTLMAGERSEVVMRACWDETAADALLTGLAGMAPELRASLFERGRDLLDVDTRNLPAVLRRWNGDASLNVLAVWMRRFPAGTATALLALPDSTVRQFEKADRGQAGSAHLDGGDVVVRAEPKLAFSWLAAAPAHFIDTCVWLAAYGEVRSRRLLRRALTRQPLFEPAPVCDGSPDSLVRLDNLLQSYATLARRLPEWVTWEKHFSGAKVLKPASIADVARRAAGRILLLQMWWVQAEIKRELAIHPEEHAALFRAMLRENRRPLTRFLRDHAASRDARLDHPANRAWLRRHGHRFNLDAWLIDPPTLSAGELTLAIERDPLEILRIGSYVGSCLAAGGINAHGAVAVLLDVNKRVVFARNAKGAFVARQIVAISDDAKLVCFAVYGHAVSKQVEDAFAEFATMWAERLGLPLAKAYEDSQRVVPIAVRSWYDDGVWDRFCA